MQRCVAGAATNTQVQILAKGARILDVVAKEMQCRSHSCTHRSNPVQADG